MAKKYLSLEEAARHAGVSVEQLKQLRERGEIRGFSDGGTWKFKTDDVEELIRSRQADSNPDVPLLTDDVDLEADSSIIGMEEEDLVSEQPTVIRGSASALDDEDDAAFLVGMTSDSDVQLIPNELLTDDGHSDMVSMGHSDSDVRLVDGSPALTDPGSDSDVKLVGGSDSDVQIVGGSDSDVRIMEDDSDSDVKLVPEHKADTEHDMAALEDDSDSDVALVAPAGSGVSLDMRDTDASVFEEDESGISLGDGSSITLAAESGISLEKIDSDLELKQKASKKSPGDSDLEISGEDSGISLEGFEDSGTSLDDDDFIGLADDSGIELSPADSGIALESLADSGIALDSASAKDRTVPMMPGSRKGTGDTDETAMEMPTLEEDSEYELSMDGAESGNVGNLIMFDEDEEFDDRQATVVKKGKGGKGGKPQASEEFDLTGDGGDFDLEDSFDEFNDDDEFAGAAVAEDDLDVADDVVGEDDELDDLDVFDEGGDDFDDDFDAGTSKPDFVAGGMGQAAVSVPVQTEWGTGPFVGLLFSTLLMAVCGMMMFDLVRSMWSWNDASTFNSPLLGIVRDMIK